ncbi:sigma 54-interacting transcriptional regulator [Azospirillum griseum]|uniref:Sigma-54-dependent Fis family transcriptional regulator n=1 Tax=Azospirillum griseum TaxID=2496639 RepID=A0A3S0KW38_9PROT|nr:sigma 54-interacting transcriptional regulator [Azospirillum griseum]RTR17071.1 sigma-54-dependent Fis family transcriptional regulator [Azospirillum griseum]
MVNPLHPVVSQDGCTVGANGEPDPLDGLVALSPAMARTLSHARKIAPLAGPVLLTGETGTGKTRLAELIHALSPHRNGPLVKKGCGELIDEILGSELFGHRKGAFTSAISDRRGILTMADGGTLLLDDIDTLSPASQSRLLRFMDDGTVTRLGDDGDGRRVQVRIIATTNRDLEARVRDGSFRDDLFYRLRRWRLHIPPLRERREDVEALARRFLDAYQAQMPPSGPVLRFDDDAIALLSDLPWRGNIRELQEVVDNVAAFGEARDGCITQDTVARVLFVPGATPCAMPGALSDDLGDDARIHRALTLTNWDISKAARIACCSRGTIYARMKERGWKRP